MPDDVYDIAIIGAGPAGATLARLLGTRYRVLLADRRGSDALADAGTDEPGRVAQRAAVARTPGSPGKTCGGLLAPSAQRELARQGLGLPRAAMSGPQLFVVRTVDLPAGLERLYQRHYLNIDRGAFDRWLVSLVPPSVDRWFGRSLIALEHEDGPGDDRGVTLRFRPRLGAPGTVRARLVVGADGAASVVRRQMFPTHAAPARYLAVQGVFDTTPTSDPYYGCAFDPELTDFYGWTIPKGDGLLVGLAAPPGGGSANARFDEFVARCRAAGFRIGAERFREAAPIARPTDPRQLVTGNGDVALLGEAAGFLSPSSAEGISYALRSARALAAALRPGLEGVAERYAVAARPIALDVTLRLGKAAAISSPATRRFLIRTGLDAVGDAREWRLPAPRLAPE